MSRMQLRLSKAVAGTLIASLVLAACSSTGASPRASGSATAGGSQPASSGAAADVPCQLPQGKNGTFKVGIANREISNDVNRDIIAGAQAEIEAAGGTVTITDAQTDARKHNENVESLINSGVDGIFIQLGDAQQLSPLATSAKAKKIFVSTALVGATAEGALTDIGFEDRLASELMTKALFDSIGNKGDVYVFWVPGAPILEVRKKRMEEIAKEHPEIRLHEVPTEHGAAKSLTQMTDLLAANPDVGSIAAVWGAYDLLISGAVEAIRRVGRNEIKAAAIDGDQIGFQMLYQKDSPFIATVVGDMKGLGRLGADAIIKAACGKANEIKTTTYTPMWLATRANGIKAGEKRWGATLWSAIKMDPAEIVTRFPQTDELTVVAP